MQRAAIGLPSPAYNARPERFAAVLHLPANLAPAVGEKVLMPMDAKLSQGRNTCLYPISKYRRELRPLPRTDAASPRESDGIPSQPLDFWAQGSLPQGHDLAVPHVPQNMADGLPGPDIRQLQSTQSSDNATDEGHNPTSFAEALQANSPFNNERLFYSGDRQGLVHSVMDICSGQRPHTERTLWPSIRSPERKKKWHTHDWTYLQSKGVFDLPNTSLCETLVAKYFTHVHSLLPIIDASHFLSQFTLGGAPSTNLLLLWSVLLAAANFASPETLQAAGYSSRKAMKRAMYARVKALYDSDYEDDKICIVQSVILLGFWYADAEDRNGPWHWLGIAIGLCQVMGLHRRPRVSLSNPSAKSRQRLYRRIWWSCFIRDRWLSLGLGRPIRINLDDCDVEMPDTLDVTAELEQLAPETANRYLPKSMDRHAEIWIKLINLSHVLGRIIRMDYRLTTNDDARGHVQAFEAELNACRLTVNQSLHQEAYSIALNRLQYEMLLEATVIVLYRPAINFQTCPDDSDSKQPEELKGLHNARAAAARVNHIIEKLVESDMVHYLRPMNLTAMIPAMQLHLYDCKSTRQLVRKFARSKLSECMMIVSELRNTYWGADFTWRLFETAQAILDSQISGEESLPARDERSSTINLPKDSEDAACQDQGPFSFDDLFLADASSMYLDQVYNDPLYSEIPDPTIADPWSLNELQNMFDMPLATGDAR
ncbi:hypothetical protein PV10_03296 [Exophiala mesophila]|uniref:Xylanolytic transcriptional activator regulatory domain-containing protein n=1 Tax=Exophiala mesophila TaxID=212818 RepID=A0A0D1ZM09_EXOME|nr:uncharacterized protein PV10_03296 [Exophiala mesophila]KIV95672.1 hypothetical protein PV10_03296 [Exophiala mesophila]